MSDPLYGVPEKLAVCLFVGVLGVGLTLGFFNVLEIIIVGFFF